MKTFAAMTLTVLLAASLTAADAGAQAAARTGASAAVQAGTHTDVRGRTEARMQTEVRGESQGSARQHAASETSLSNAAGVDVETVLRSTVEAGLPEAPVHRTVAEGRAKGAAEVEVARAALKTQGRLLLAREALESGGEQPSQAEIVLGAEALLRGAARADLERIGDAAADGRSLEMSLKALLSLQAGGQSVPDASARIAAQLPSGAGVVSGAVGSATSTAAGAVHIGAGLAGSIGAGILP